MRRVRVVAFPLVLAIVDAHGAEIVTDGVPLVVPVPSAAGASAR